MLQVKVEDLIIYLKREGKLTAPEFFKSARATKWGAKLDSELLVNTYNFSLGRLLAMGMIEMSDAQKALE